MNHHAPHGRQRFEGYFTRFDLPNGSLAIVICSVPDAADVTLRHCVSIRYVRGNGEGNWGCDVYLRSLDFHPLDSEDAGFRFVGRGDVSSTPKGQDNHVELHATPGAITYALDLPAYGIDFHATASQRQPWRYLSRTASGAPTPASLRSTPAGVLSYLPLPLQWHVHSLASATEFTLSLPEEAGLDERDVQGRATAHEEKNWGNGFPVAHVWGMGCKYAPRAQGGGRGALTSSITLAGGRTMGVEAFLIGYRNTALDLSLDYTPPWALRVFNISPTLSFSHDYASRTYVLSVTGLVHSIRIEASAEKETFYKFAAPTPIGFRANWMDESLRGLIKVSVWKRSWLRWNLVSEEEFDGAGVEFGGEYYPDRG